MVVGRVNQVLEGVVDVEVEWTGADLHGRVGEHIVQCKVTRLASSVHSSQEHLISTDELGRQLVTQCFHVPFTILDTNECLLAEGHPMRHKCHESSRCVNTVGSYECLCRGLDDELAVTIPETVDDLFWLRLDTQKRSPWDLSFSSAALTSCPSAPSTYGCCPEHVHTKDGASCRASFRCPEDPCIKHHTCAHSAKCARTESPMDEPNYKCQCPDHLMGNGHVCRPGIDVKPQPKVGFDGTPTKETIDNDYYCDCTKPVVDACAGFPPCKGRFFWMN